MNKLDGFFINPLLALSWDQCASHLRRMKQMDAKTVVLQWTTAHGYSVYPSSLYPSGWHHFDLIERILAHADELEMQVWLGLDACRTITEEHYDPTKSPASRCINTASELIELYGKHRSLTGFYIPFELDAPSRSLLEKITSHCHSLDKPVLCSILKPRLIPEGRHYEFNEQDQEWVAREKACIGNGLTLGKRL